VDVLIDYYVCAVCFRPTNPIFSYNDVDETEIEGHDDSAYGGEIASVFGET
jgi:hypothetical protein